jgi:DNA-binding transcriptional MerR regulator
VPIWYDRTRDNYGNTARAMKSFTKAEFIRACGEFFEESSELWQRRTEQWTEEGILHTVDNPHSSSGRARRYSEEEVYIALVLFRLKAIGFSLSTIKAVSSCLHASFIYRDWPSEFVREAAERARNYWNACKDDTWNAERMDGSPILTIVLIPDSGRGFGPNELEVLLQLGENAEIIPGCEAIRLNLQQIFAAARVRPRRVTLSVPAGALQQILVAG